MLQLKPLTDSKRVRSKRKKNDSMGWLHTQSAKNTIEYSNKKLHSPEPKTLTGSSIDIATLRGKKPWFPSTSKNKHSVKYDYEDDKLNRDFRSASIYVNQMKYKIQSDKHFLPKLKAQLSGTQTMTKYGVPRDASSLYTSKQDIIALNDSKGGNRVPSRDKLIKSSKKKDNASLWNTQQSSDLSGLKRQTSIGRKLQHQSFRKIEADPATLKDTSIYQKNERLYNRRKAQEEQQRADSHTMLFKTLANIDAVVLPKGGYLKKALNLEAPSFNIIDTPIRQVITSYDNKLDPKKASTHTKIQNVGRSSALEVQFLVNDMCMTQVRKHHKIDSSDAIQVSKFKIFKKSNNDEERDEQLARIFKLDKDHAERKHDHDSNDQLMPTIEVNRDDGTQKVMLSDALKQQTIQEEMHSSDESYDFPNSDLESEQEVVQHKDPRLHSYDRRERLTALIELAEQQKLQERIDGETKRGQLVGKIINMAEPTKKVSKSGNLQAIFTSGPPVYKYQKIRAMMDKQQEEADLRAQELEAKRFTREQERMVKQMKKEALRKQMEEWRKATD